MDAMTLYVIVGGIIGASGAALVAARRYKNDDSSAGEVVAGVTLILLFLWMTGLGHFMK